MFISCQSKECDFLEFFHHENQSFPAALSDGGKLHSGQKSLLASILEAKNAVLDAKPEASVIIVDGSALINALTPRALRKFEEYANKNVFPKVEAFLAEIGLEELWLAFGQGANLLWIPIHDSRNNIGPDKAKGITFFHACTGCDVLSAFRGKGKRKAWQKWDVYPEATVVFANLSTYPPVIGDEEKKVLERFGILMYDKSSSATDIDSVRLDLFARKQRAYDAIPTTSTALEYHTKRAAYQVLIPSEWMGMEATRQFMDNYLDITSTYC